MSERKLQAWQEAGLIDADTAARIRAWDAEHARPYALWALIGLGALAVGLGIILVVAANWDDIPGTVRLGIHLALMAGLSGFLWWRGPAADGDFYSDAQLFILATLALTFFAHLGQVYQTSSPLWQPLLAWLLVFTPLLLSFGRGWPIAAMWMAGVMGTVLNHASENDPTWHFGSYNPPLSHPILYWGLIAAPPMIVAAMAAAMRGRSSRPGFWRLLEQFAVLSILAGLSLFTLGWSGDERWPYIDGSLAIHSLILLGTAVAIFAARRTESGRATAGMLAVGALLHLLQAIMPHSAGWTHNHWLNALFFMGLWGAVAYAALHARWRRIFQIAIGVLAIRLIMLSFELNEDLLQSGLGLIVAGLLTLGISWVAIQISRRLAPKEESRA